MKRLALVAVLVAAGSASAHFKINAPASWAAQDFLGSPQKSAPCGQADPGSAAVPTNAVTTVTAGSMLTIRINETIFHKGHYRVSLAPTQAALPADPVVTPGTGTPCGSTAIETNPQLPLLADGLLVHTTPLSGEQTMQVPIPAGMSCTNCVLQVTEFMSEHGLNNPGGCYYHHCAVLNVTGGAGGGTGGGSGGGSAIGGGAGGGDTGASGGGSVGAAGSAGGGSGSVADAGTGGGTAMTPGCSTTGAGVLAGVALAMLVVAGIRRRVGA